jgi:hypothetical protein
MNGRSGQIDFILADNLQERADNLLVFRSALPSILHK